MQSFLQYRRFRATVEKRLERDRAKAQALRTGRHPEPQPDMPQSTTSDDSKYELEKDIERGDFATSGAVLEPRGRQDPNHVLRDIGAEKDDNQEPAEDTPVAEEDEDEDEDDDCELAAHRTTLSRISTQQSAGVRLGQVLTGIEVRKRRTIGGGDGHEEEEDEDEDDDYELAAHSTRLSRISTQQSAGVRLGQVLTGIEVRKRRTIEGGDGAKMRTHDDESTYQCLSVDHEVLTDFGWKGISAVEVGDWVMTLDLSTGLQQWDCVEATTRSTHTGPLYRLHSHGLDVVCNDRHLWYLNTKELPGVFTPFTTQQMRDTQLIPLRGSKGTSLGQWDRKSGTTTHKNHKIPVVGHNGNTMYEWPECSWLPREFVKDEACNLDWCRFIGFVLGDGRIGHEVNAKGQSCLHSIKVYQSTSKPEAMVYIEELLQRLAAKIPGFVVSTPSVTGKLYRWTIPHRKMYDFFLPMVRGPQSYDPLNDEMCKAYSAPYYRERSISKADNEPGSILPVPAGWKQGNWWYLRRWIYYYWLFLLSRNQARAMIKGIAAADGAWSTVVKARSDTGGAGRGAKRVKSSLDSVHLDNVRPERKEVPLINRAYVTVFNSSIPLMHDLSVLGHLADTRVSFGLMHKKGEWMPSIGARANANGWYISFSFAESELTVAAPKPELYQNPRHDGFVYCLTVPNGNFLARRSVEYSDDDNAQEILHIRQKPFFTGNSAMGEQLWATDSE